MIFDRREKEWLKKEGLWEKVKDYAQKDGDYLKDPEKFGILGDAFYWGETEEGYSYWEEVEARMQGELNNA